MRILIDLQGAQTESRFRGIGRYSMALTKEIARQGNSHDVWLVLNGNFAEAADAIKNEFYGLIPRNRIVTFKTPVRGLNRWNDVWRMQAAELLRETFLANFSPDIVYVTSLLENWTDGAVTSVGILETTGKTAVTFYDLIPLTNPEKYLPDQSVQDFYFRKIEFLKKTDAILSISEYSRREAIDSLHLPPQRVVNVSAAADAIFRPVETDLQEIQALLKRYGVTHSFIMYAGGFDSRKNVPRLLEAFSLLPTDLRDHHQLLIAGKALPNVKAELKAQAVKYGIESQVMIADYIPDEDLVCLYNACTLFVLPSLHEGFGLPALEAMACGAPVVGANTTSIPEVIGCEDALFDPTNIEDIVEKIVQVLKNEDLRNFLRVHGLRQSQNFSWQISARRALDAFESLLPEKVSERQDSPLIIKQHYNKLIAAIGNVPQAKSRVTDQDLVEIAQCIWENEQTVNQALQQRWS